MILKKQMILNNEVNLNNRRYPDEVLESIKNQINSNPKEMNIGTIGDRDTAHVNLRDASFTYSNAVVENGVLYADVEILKTMMGDELKRILEIAPTEIVFRPRGIGTFEGEMPEETKNLLNIPNRISMDYKIVGMSAIDKSKDAFNIIKE